MVGQGVRIRFWSGALAGMLVSAAGLAGAESTPPPAAPAAAPRVAAAPESTGPGALPPGEAAEGKNEPPADAAAAGSASGGVSELRSELRERPRLIQRAERLAALFRGELDPSVDAEVLFDFRLADAALVELERKQLRAWLEEQAQRDRAEEERAEDPAGQPSPSDDAASPPAPNESLRPKSGQRPAPQKDTAAQPVGAAQGSASLQAGDGAQPSEAGDAAASQSEPPPSEPELLRLSREELHRVVAERQLDFLSLPDKTRARILQDHEAARLAYLAERDGAAEARQRAQAAEKARQEAIEAVRIARTEAERLVAEERARLLEIRRRHAETEEALTLAERQARLREESFLKLQRRVREAQSSPEDREVALRVFRECNDAAHAASRRFAVLLSSDPRQVKEVGPNVLTGLDLAVDTNSVLTLRSELLAEQARLERLAKSVLWEQRDQLYKELRGTGASRLALLALIPAEERAEVMSLSGTGLRQATFEVGQVLLILRYHTQLTSHWLKTLRQGRQATGPGAFTVGSVAAQVLLFLWIFFGVRRRIPSALRLMRERVQESLRQQPEGGGQWLRVVRVLEEVQGPGLLLLLIALTWSRLPEAARTQLELSLLFYSAMWLTSANLLIHLIDAVFGGTEAMDSSDAARLRLKSLRLVGRTGALIGLTLTLTERLVGEGTIYSWVVRLTWALVIPSLLLLCHWWRPWVHRTFEAERKRTALQNWILAHKSGLIGLLAAGVGGLDSLRTAVSRTARKWADDFVVTQRLGAYLFQRELDRRASEEQPILLLPIDDEKFEALGPSHPLTTPLPLSSDADLAPVEKALARKKGGVFALVGERGAGKSTRVQFLSSEHRSFLVHCRDTVPELRESLADALGAEPDASLAALFEQVHEQGYEMLVLDGAQRLIHPWIGGIASFDELVDCLRPLSRSFCTVMTFEDSVWNFFEGARGACPTFDHVVHLKPWTEQEIRTLIESRSREAGIRPKFQRLVAQLPKDADGYDWADAIDKAKKSYYRLIWDYSAGNPAVALHMWRRSLAVSEMDDVYVQLFQAPRAEEIEQLPDSGAFVLRAIVQLGFATIQEITQVTRLGERVILDTIRYAMAAGMVYETSQGYRITWAWYRAISRYLQRRHLLSIQHLRRVGDA